MNDSTLTFLKRSFFSIIAGGDIIVIFSKLIEVGALMPYTLFLAMLDTNV